MGGGESCSCSDCATVIGGRMWGSLCGVILVSFGVAQADLNYAFESSAFNSGSSC